RLGFVRVIGEVYLDLFRSGFGPAIPTPAFRRVSVVIPARNAGRLLGRTIAAVKAQANADLEVEVVVVDDGSTDDTAAAAATAGARVVTRAAGREQGNP